MVSIEKIQRAITNAQAAGDAAAVARLQKLLAEQQKVPNAPVVETGRSWGDVGAQAVKSFGPSLYKYGEDIATAVMNPIDTIGTMGDIGAGALREGARAVLPDPVFKAIDSLDNKEAANRVSDTATAVGRHYKGRWGSVEGFKQALAEDPVGVLSDLSVPVTGGAGLAAKVPGVVGKVARTVRVAGDLMDPISAAGRAGNAGGRALSNVIGMSTGVGDEPIRAGFNAARAGGAKSEAFYDNMRGNVPVEDVVPEAKAAMGDIKAAGQAEYRREIASSKANMTPVNWNNIFRSVYDTINSMRTSSGRFYGGDAGKAMVQEVLGKIQQYVADPALHNVEGLDALKQELSDLQITPGPSVKRAQASANRIVTKILDGIRKEIIRIDPKYEKTMARYSDMSNRLRELERSLSLNAQASTDTALRKLQSTMRNNVQTNYGARGTMLDELDAVGAGTLRPALAGQSLNTWAPRGIARAGGAMALPAAALYAMYNPGMVGAMAALAPFASPRLMGEITGLLGSGANKVDKVVAKTPQPVRKGVQAVTGPTGRQVIRQAGVMENEADAMMTDAKGNVYDRKGRLIRRASE